MFLFRHKKIRSGLLSKQSRSLQYVSNLRVDGKGSASVIAGLRVDDENLAIVGGLGWIMNPEVKSFLHWASRCYRNVFFVPGTDEYGCTVMLRTQRSNEVKPMLTNVCSQFDNVHLLDNKVFELDNINGKVIIAGTTLWSEPEFSLVYGESSRAHRNAHTDSCRWIQSVKKRYTEPIIMLTYHLPSHKILTNVDRYGDPYSALEYGMISSADDSLITSPIKAWIVGHNMAVNCNVNGIPCLTANYGRRIIQEWAYSIR